MTMKENNKNKKREVDTSKLYEGQIIKNYKELCRILNEDTKGGNAKRSQTKKWRQYFDFENNSQKYLIKEIYPEPLLIDINNNKSYIQMVCNNILILLYSLNKEKIILTKNNLMKDIGMVNDLYGEKEIEHILKIKSGIEFKSKESEKFFIDEFYKVVGSRTGTLLNRAFKRLIDLHLIEKNNTYLLIYDNIVNGVKIGQKFKSVTYEDKKEIENIYNDILNENDYMGESEVLFLREEDKNNFYEEINKRLKLTFGCSGHAKAIEIKIFSEERIRRELNDNIDKLGINKKFVEIAKKAFETKYINNNYQGIQKLIERNENENENEDENENILMYSDDYILTEHSIVDNLIQLRKDG